MNNREIKFRSFDPILERFLYLPWNGREFPKIEDISYDEINNFSLNQSVGLFTDDGYEIYENDIVKCRLSYLPKESEKITGIVEFSTETLSYILKFQNEGEIYSEELCLYRDFEVVGNIYENSSLAAGLGLS